MCKNTKDEVCFEETLSKATQDDNQSWLNKAHSTSWKERKRALVHRDVVDSKVATGEEEFVRDVNKKRCYLAFGYDTKLTSTGKRTRIRPPCSQTETSSLSAL